MLFELDANGIVDVITSTVQNNRIFICYVKRQANVIVHIITL